MTATLPNADSSPVTDGAVDPAIEPPGRTATAIQALASSYAERLSCIRCGASQVELDENAVLIHELEIRARTSPAIRLRRQLDPTLYLG